MFQTRLTQLLGIRYPIIQGGLPLISGRVNEKAAIGGDLDEGFAYAGQGVGLIRDVPRVADLMERIVREAGETARRLAGLAEG